jgi:hypothetical protein
MKTKEEIEDRISTYEHYIREWVSEDEISYWREIKLCKRLINELEWILELEWTLR